jgi:uroporphyrin-3 C-methyltransferase
MNEQSDIMTSPPLPQQRKRRGGFFFRLLLLVGICGFSYFGWQQVTNSQRELQQQITALKSDVKKLQTDFQALFSQEEQEQVPSDLEAQIKALSAQVQHLDRNQTTLFNRIQQPQPRAEDWVLAETTYLLTLANHRLLLAQEVEGALAALQKADDNLRPLTQPAVLAVKTQLAEEIKQLRAVERPDLAGIAVRLARFAAEAEKLPLLQGTHQIETAPAPSQTRGHSIENWQDLVAVIWGQLKPLVVLRYSTDADTGLLSPEQRHFVMQSLRLKLEMARLALLRRDTQNFATAIQAVHHWLERYYDQNNNEVKSLRQELANIQKMELTPQLPDITGSLKLLQRLSSSNNQPAETVTPP